MTDQMTEENDELTQDAIDEIVIPEESKSDRFSRLASARLNKLLKQFDLLANCSGYNYEYTQEQVDKMLSHIDKRRASLEKAFRPDPADDKVVL